MDIEDRLHKLKETVIMHFPDLSGEISVEQQFLHMWNFCPQGIQYLPNFHLIFQAQGNETMLAKVIT